jgi:hypothetical protein
MPVDPHPVGEAQDGVRGELGAVAVGFPRLAMSASSSRATRMPGNVSGAARSYCRRIPAPCQADG